MNILIFSQLSSEGILKRVVERSCLDEILQLYAISFDELVFEWQVSNVYNIHHCEKRFDKFSGCKFDKSFPKKRSTRFRVILPIFLSTRRWNDGVNIRQTEREFMTFSTLVRMFSKIAGRWLELI